MSSSEITTILGRGSSFDGKLTFEGTVRIDGRFSGEIHTSGTLIVGETAEVEAQVQAASIVVHGKVKGDLTASESLEIQAPARVLGNLKTPSLTIHKGSVFQGACQMEAEGARAARSHAKGAHEAAVA